MIGGNASWRDQSHVNISHMILDWFRPSHEVIVIHVVLMYYAIEIDSSSFLLGPFRVFPRDVSDSFLYHLDMDLPSLFIVDGSLHRV
jgi:hypothetical protein